MTIAPPEIAARSFADDEALLADVLQEVIGAAEGPRALDLHRRAVELGRRSRGGDADAADALAALVAELGGADLELLIRSLTRWFQLVNLAEDNERVRRLRRREHREAPAPRRGSLRDAVARLAADGTSAAELRETLARAEVRLVMTAHPTEARRRTTVAKVSRIFAMLRALDERRPVPGEETAVRTRIAATVQELWGSDELRAVSPSVLDEVRAGLVYFTSTLAEVVPATYRDLEAALEECFPDEEVAVPPLLTFGSWMGGDRDGNPNVTPEVTAEALALMRDACLRHLERGVLQLAERVSLSARVVGEPEDLAGPLAALAARFPAAAAELVGRNPQEPFRRFFSLLATRIRATRSGHPEAYGEADELLADLRLADASLRRHGGGFVAAGELRDAIRRVEVFGFHFARLDVRRPPRRPRARRYPPRGARPDPRRARRAGGLRGPGTSPRSSTRPPRSARSPACSSARDRRSASRRPGSRTSGRSPGSSRGRRPGRCSPPGTGSAPRSRPRARSTASRSCARCRPAGRSSPR